MMLAGYPDTLKIVYSDGEEAVLELCRIDNDKKIFTKDTRKRIPFGTKLIKTHEDGWTETFVAKNGVESPSNLGIKEILVSRI